MKPRAEKIALFVPSLRVGGAEQVMIRLANTASSLGVPVDLLVCDADGLLRSRVAESVRIVDLGTGRVLTSVPFLVRYLKRQKPHALLSTLAHANLVALWSQRLAHTPTRVIVREATTLSISSSWARGTREKWMPLLARKFYRWADVIVAPSQGVAHDLVQMSIAPPERVHVIYNPVVTPELYRKSQEAVDHPWLVHQHTPVVLAVGRLTAAKDYPTLLRAFAKVRQQLQAKLIILGDGEERRRLQVLIKDLELAEEVSLPGFVDNPYAYMSRASVFVLSSRWEGMPNALIEALGLGMSVVSTDCPSGPREILEDGQLGTLVPVADADRMAEAILHMLHTPHRVDCSRIVQRFGVLPVTQAYLQVMGIG